MVLTSPVLETKVHAPRPRPSLVARPRLSQRLDRITESKLILISAPAGFGKSTLLAEWLASARDDGQVAGWLSVDEADNEPAAFWTYLISALRTAVPGIGEASLRLLESPQPRIENLLAPLLNELSALPNDVVLVLDDFHVIHAPDIQEAMAYLLDHLPGPMHLVIATRADPALPLARLRARGELVEIRAADLRFTPEEATAYLNDVMGLDLGARDVAALEGRTEGWIAALQLAGLSMQGRDDVPGFIAGFAGDDRYIVDYLVEEVLHRQTDDVRSFLLQTSILARMTGPLCDAVTGRDGSRATLDALDRANLFVVSLDDRREWYRYHHLFADVLRARLLDERPDEVAELHRRASEWFEQHGEPGEAIAHAMAGEDFERAADLIEIAIPGMRQARQHAVLRRWLEVLPDELIGLRPVLSVHYAGLLLANGDFDDADARLRDAERWLAATEGAREGRDAASSAVVVRDEDGFRRLPSQVAIYRAAMAQGRGDRASAITYAQSALDLTDDDDHFERGAAAGFLALAHWSVGQLGAAHRYWTAAMTSLQSAGHLVDAIGCARALAQIRVAQGRMRDAMSTYARGLQLATEQRVPALRGTADMHVGISELFLEWGDLGTARQHLQESKELGDQAGLPQNPYRWHLAMARIREAEGDPDGSLDLLDEAERLFVSEYYPDVRPVAALRARIWATHGRLGDAAGWVRAQALSVEDDLDYLHEFEHTTLARLLLVQSKQDHRESSTNDTITLLDRLLRAAEEGQRMRSVIEILVLQALARQVDGDVRAALAPLARALTLGEPEGYVRIFVDEGSAMAALLEAAATDGIAPSYVRRLLAAFGGADDNTYLRQALVEPLSERELDVLRLLATDLDGPEIASELVVALSTIRSHTKSIYAKLGVNNRRAAVRRAEELDLLSLVRDNQPRHIVVRDA